MAATSEIWERSDVTPSGRNFFATWKDGRKLSFFSLTAFILKRYQTAIRAVIICPAMVATAAPIMPHLHTKIRIGSKIMLKTAPASVETMAKRGLPSDLMTGFMACPNT